MTPRFSLWFPRLGAARSAPAPAAASTGLKAMVSWESNIWEWCVCTHTSVTIYIYIIVSIYIYIIVYIYIYTQNCCRWGVALFQLMKSPNDVEFKEHRQNHPYARDSSYVDSFSNTLKLHLPDWKGTHLLKDSDAAQGSVPMDRTPSKSGLALSDEPRPYGSSTGLPYPPSTLGSLSHLCLWRPCTEVVFKQHWTWGNVGTFTNCVYIPGPSKS